MAHVSVQHAGHDAISKVRPVKLPGTYFTDLDDQETEPEPQMQKLDIPVSKVRPFAEEEPSDYTRQYHLHVSKVRPFDESVDLLVSSGDEQHPSLTDSSRPSTRARALTSAARACSVDSFSTLGSHKGHHHLPKLRARSDASILADPRVGVASAQQHAMDECLTTNAELSQEVHPLASCEELASADPALEEHELGRDERHPVKIGPEQHELSICQRCSAMEGVPQHRIMDCALFPVTSPDTHAIQACATATTDADVDTHRVSTCDEYPVYKGAAVHAMKTCIKCAAERRLPGHRVSQCLHVPVYTGHAKHAIEGCARCSFPGNIVVHESSRCEKYPVYRGPIMHEINKCANCLVDAGVAGGAHRISLCPKHAVYAGPARHSVAGDILGPSILPPGRHAVESCGTQPVHQGPASHDLEICVKCPADPLGDRHRISDCPEYPTYQIAPGHGIEECTKCDVGNLRRHTIQTCDKFPDTGPGSGHLLGDDDVHLIPESPDEHSIQEDPEYAYAGSSQEHLLRNDVKHTIDEVIEHDLQLCTACAFENPPQIHRLSECHRRQSDALIAAPVPVHDEKTGRRLSHWERTALRGHTESSQTEQFFDADSDKADTPTQTQNAEDPQPKDLSRAQSIGSLLDYTKATQWLRGLIQSPEGYTSKLTSLPSRGSNQRLASSDDNGPTSESDTDGRARSSTGKSSHPSLLDSKIDKFQFRRAVSDLERLLSEAVTLAAGVADSTEPERHQPYKEPSISLHSHCHSLSPVDDSTSSGGTILPLQREDILKAIRIPMKHASTFPGPLERPRLQEMVKNYSDKRERPEQPPSPSVDTPVSKHIAFEIPDRQSSKRLVKKVIPHESALPTFRLSAATTLPDKNTNVQKAVKNSEDVVDFQDYFSHHENQPAASELATKSGQSPPVTTDHDHSEVYGQPMHGEHGISLRHRSHISLPGTKGFSLAKSHKRQPIARDWSPLRKRFVATVACLSTALIGVILGIYAGIVPSMQYYIIDNAHVMVHGNTGCFLGLALPTFFCWPLPLLHGRKPYILGSLIVAMSLLFPQAVSVSTQRLENTGPWRAMLLVSRTLMGAALGFASMNFHSILTDLFGASLMSTNPHQEVADICDARRHGGGMGVWLGIWTWCWLGSLGVGFLVGAVLIDYYPPVWGFYVSIMLVVAVLLLNVVSPEVRRSAYRRSIAEVRSGEDISRRLARGEIMMHRLKTGPTWWGEEVYHGILLCGEMLRQPGFFVVAVYTSWIYAQVVLLISLLGSLASIVYRFYSTGVGLLVASLSLGALLAVPFQKANLFSRSRQAQLDTNRATLENKVAWTSHLVRRLIFTTMLPICGVCYACFSYGPPLSIAAPTIFATLVGFLSCLAISECNGLMMETFDTSDLSPGMTGRQKGSENRHSRRTNYSSFPRVTAGYAVIHTFAFILAAGATALAGRVTRRLGQQVASGVVAGILFLFTIALLLGLARFKDVQIVPNSKARDMDRLSEVRRKSTMRRASMPDDPQAVMEEEDAWRPVMIGNPISKMRRMNIFELGSMSRWQEIRKKNKLIDEGTHLNRAALGDGFDALDDQFADLRSGAQDLLRIGSTRSKGSRRLRRSDRTSDRSQPSVEMDDLSFKSGDQRGGTPGQMPDRVGMKGQTVTEETEEEMSAVRRRSIARGKQPEV